jgi:hypothetical protein
MTTTAEEKAEKEALKARNKEMEVREKALNQSRSGKGTRVFLGMTRGRNPQEIQYENWDDSQPDTLPLTLSEFMELKKVANNEDITEKDIVRRLILGDNEIFYTEASDPIAEFVDSLWDDKFKANFRMVIRNYSQATKLSIEDTVALLKPAMVAALTK